MENRQLIHNSVTCLECGEVLESLHVHDYRTCNCPQATSVDGGLSYERFGGKDLAKIQSNHIYSDSPFEVIREHVTRGGRGRNMDEKLKYVKLQDINESWLAAIITYEEEHRPNNRYLPYYRQEVE